MTKSCASEKNIIFSTLKEQFLLLIFAPRGEQINSREEDNEEKAGNEKCRKKTKD